MTQTSPAPETFTELGTIQRLDAMETIMAEMLIGLEAVIQTLDAFAERAEPLLVEVERKVARKGRLFGGNA